MYVGTYFHTSHRWLIFELPHYIFLLKLHLCRPSMAAFDFEAGAADLRARRASLGPAESVGCRCFQGANAGADGRSPQGLDQHVNGRWKNLDQVASTDD